MKTLSYIALPLLLVPLISHANEIDQDFLSSLPEDVRSDVLQKIETKKDLDQPIYRKASTKVDKDIQDNLIFGRNFFDTIQSSFMPVNEPNLEGSYILDFGDVIQIQLIGQKDNIDSYEINRDGSVDIPEIGKIFLSGLSLNEASILIKTKIQDSYIGTEAFVTLTSIRDINILIAGNAYNPGIYTLNGNTNVLHALSMAGGVSDIGSLRNISIVRDGKVIDKIDLYNVLIYGFHNFKIGLLSGDSIVVNPIKKIVSIESGVLRPSTYELLEDETLSDLIKLSNGLNNNANTENIYVLRNIKGVSLAIDVDHENIDKFDLKNGDSVFIKEYKVNTVKLNGAIKNPGTYQVPAGTTLSEIIAKAGGYEDTAYPFGGYLNNKNAADINEQSKDKLYNEFINNLIRNSSSVGINVENIGLALKQIKDASISGRVIAEFDLNVIKNSPELDTVLEDEDEIYIPNISQQVFVHGEISNPGAVRYSPGKNIEYYINSAGGPKKSADYENIYVVHPNGETINYNDSRLKLSFIEVDEKNLIYPGSIIYLPSDMNFASSAEVASVWAPIISSIALSLTSLSVLNNSN